MNLPTVTIGPKSCLPNGLRLFTVCKLFCIIAGFAHQGLAQETAFTGVWTYSRDADEKTMRYEAIDQATNDVNKLIRARMRQGLQDKTEPAAEIRLNDRGDRVTVTGRNRDVTFTTDWAPNRVQTEHGIATIRAKRKDGKLIVTSEAPNGTQTTEYRLSEDGTQLVLEVSISSDKLPKPVRFRTTYRRKPQ
jgi:hypothetical protein